ERDVVVAPAAANRDGNLVSVLAFKGPVIDRSDMLDEVDGMRRPVWLEFNQGHKWSVLGKALSSMRPRGRHCWDTQEELACRNYGLRIVLRKQTYTAHLIQGTRPTAETTISCG